MVHHSSWHRRASIAIAVVAIFIFILNQQSEVAQDPSAAAQGIRKRPLGKIECAQCDVNSIPNISPSDLENDPECSGHADWFYRDTSNNTCSFCQYGTYDAKTAAQGSSSIARKILLDQNFRTFSSLEAQPYA